MVVEYRMSRPFEVAMQHGTRKPIKWSEGPGVHVGTWAPLRKAKPDLIASAYDVLRGEQYVRLRFMRGPSLTADANGRRLELAAWSVPDARNVKWRPPVQGAQFCPGIGTDLLHFGESSEQEEYLIVYVGTDVRRWTE